MRQGRIPPSRVRLWVCGAMPSNPRRIHALDAAISMRDAGLKLRQVAEELRILGYRNAWGRPYSISWLSTALRVTWTEPARANHPDPWEDAETLP